VSVEWKKVGALERGDRIELGFECVRVLEVYAPVPMRAVRVLGRDGVARTERFSDYSTIRVVPAENRCAVDRFKDPVA
jgi:hypothetical protein